MGQKVNPNGFRVGVIRDWNTRWYASKKEFSDFLIEDKKIRDHLKEVHYAAGIARIDIMRRSRQAHRPSEPEPEKGKLLFSSWNFLFRYINSAVLYSKNMPK